MPAARWSFASTALWETSSKSVAVTKRVSGWRPPVKHERPILLRPYKAFIHTSSSKGTSNIYCTTANRRSKAKGGAAIGKHNLKQGRFMEAPEDSRTWQPKCTRPIATSLGNICRPLFLVKQGAPIFQTPPNRPNLPFASNTWDINTINDWP